MAVAHCSVPPSGRGSPLSVRLWTEPRWPAVTDCSRRLRCCGSQWAPLGGKNKRGTKTGIMIHLPTSRYIGKCVSLESYSFNARRHQSQKASTCVWHYWSPREKNISNIMHSKLYSYMYSSSYQHIFWDRLVNFFSFYHMWGMLLN